MCRSLPWLVPKLSSLLHVIRITRIINGSSPAQQALCSLLSRASGARCDKFTITGRLEECLRGILWDLDEVKVEVEAEVEVEIEVEVFRLQYARGLPQDLEWGFPRHANHSPTPLFT